MTLTEPGTHFRLDAPLFDLIEDDDVLDPLRFPMVIGGEGIDPETLRQDIGPHEHLVRLKTKHSDLSLKESDQFCSQAVLSGGSVSADTLTSERLIEDETGGLFVASQGVLSLGATVLREQLDSS